MGINTHTHRRSELIKNDADLRDGTPILQYDDIAAAQTNEAMCDDLRAHTTTDSSTDNTSINHGIHSFKKTHSDTLNGFVSHCVIPGFSVLFRFVNIIAECLHGVASAPGSSGLKWNPHPQWAERRNFTLIVNQCSRKTRTCIRSCRHRESNRTVFSSNPECETSV